MFGSMLVMNVTEIHQEARTDTTFFITGLVKTSQHQFIQWTYFVYYFCKVVAIQNQKKQIDNIWDWDMAWQVQEIGGGDKERMGIMTEGQ